MRLQRSALALLGALLLLGAVSCSPGARSRPRVLLVGIDGASWKVLGPLVERGEAPNFARLLRQGAAATDFATLPVTISPQIWTTVATGRAPADHGITGFTTDLPNGKVIPASSSARRVRAVWEIASQRGVPVGVLDWWASWPAEEVRGYVVSDHANPSFVEELVADRTYWSADTRVLDALRRNTYPPEVESKLDSCWLGKDSFPYDDLQRDGRFSDGQMAVLRDAPWNVRDVYSWLKTYYRVDRPMVCAALALRRSIPVDLQMVYFHGPDPVQHYGWDLVEPEKYLRQPAHLERDRGLIEGVYRVFDGFVGELEAGLADDAWVIVMSDHGAEPSMLAHDPKMVRPGEHGPNAKGVLFIAGPHVRPGFRIVGATPYDIAPTLLWLLRLPVAADLPGKPLVAAFTDEFAGAQPVERVATYGPRPTSPPIPSPADAEMLKSLRNLGYIQ